MLGSFSATMKASAAGPAPRRRQNHIAPETKDAAEAGQAADLAEGPRQRRAAHAAASSTCSNSEEPVADRIETGLVVICRPRSFT